MSSKENHMLPEIKAYRDSSDIILRILKHLVSDSQSKTEIMMEARMSYTQLKSYLAMLLEKQLIVQDKNNPKARSKKTQSFKITPKGIEVIQAIEKLRSLLS